MSKVPEVKEVDEDEWNEFQQWKQFKERRAHEGEKKEESKNGEKEEYRGWICRDCGKRLAPADWDERRLKRQHPDGCPRCGGLTADKLD